MATERGYLTIEPAQIDSLRQLGVADILRELGIPKMRLPGLLSDGVKRLRGQVTALDLIDGMEALLKSTADLPVIMGILTSNSVENVESFLKAHKLDGLFEFVSSTSRLNGKAKHIKSILRTFSLTPDRLLYIGDEIRDIKASQKAGVDVAAVTWGFNAKEALQRSNPTFLVETPGALSHLIE